MKSSLERRLAKLEEALLHKRKNRPIKVFFIPNKCTNLSMFYAQCEAETPRDRQPFYIEFIGPTGGQELGTGPFKSDDNEF